MRQLSRTEQIVNIRQELLSSVEAVYGRPATGDDDIFSLGGTSLQAMDLVFRFEATLGTPVDVERLISAVTIEQLIEELVASHGRPTK